MPKGISTPNGVVERLPGRLPTLGDVRRAMADLAHLPDHLPAMRDDSLPLGIFAVYQNGNGTPEEVIVNIPTSE